MKLAKCIIFVLGVGLCLYGCQSSVNINVDTPSSTTTSTTAGSTTTQTDQATTTSQGGQTTTTSSADVSTSTSPSTTTTSPTTTSQAGPTSTTTTSTSTTTTTTPAFSLSSTAFSSGEVIPNKYCYNVDGGEGVPAGAANTSIPLSWSNAPAGTQSFAVSVVDPDGNNWSHWLILNIPSSTTSLAEGASGSIAGATEYHNEYGTAGYGGPLPPKADNAHRYVITVYALNQNNLSFTNDTNPNDGYTNLIGFAGAINEKILSQATITGTYNW